MRKWAVVACDQFTTDKAYWDKLDQEIGDAPSTLRMMLPEAFLEEPDVAARMDAVNRTMRDYLDGGVFEQHTGVVVLERATQRCPVRRGLMLGLDLEDYSWQPGTKALIRASEKTVPERIPPRVEIRRGAALELPHAMVLIDDPDDAVMSAAQRAARDAQTLYDFELLADGGHLTGKLLSPDAAEPVLSALDGIVRDDGKGGKLLFVVGDGNHSIAAAKALWDEVKQAVPEADRAVHPARYALVEVVNLWDAGIVMEPIHRTLFSVDASAMIQRFLRYCEQMGIKAGVSDLSEEELKHCYCLDASLDVALNELCIVSAEKRLRVQLSISDRLCVSVVQGFLNDCCADAEVDYVHGDARAIELGTARGNLSMLLPAIDKSAIFTTVIQEGLMPRKSFSMGHAEEKRYYNECRRIV